MKVLHVTRNYLHGGGGAIAMNRLHKALRASGIDSNILSKVTSTDSLHSFTISSPRALRIIESRLGKLGKRLGLNDIHAVTSFSIKKNRPYRHADILHLHGIHGGFFNYFALPGLTKNKPTVFTLHDIWAYTGHCAYSYDCDRWKKGCGNCPYPGNHPAIKKDNTRLEWKLKDWVFRHSNLVVVTLSGVQTEQVKESFLRHLPTYQIPNGVDTRIFEPIDPQECRNLLKIPEHKKVLLFSALDLNQHNKGGDLLIQALKLLPKSMKSEMLLLTLGRGGEAIGRMSGIQVINLGYVSNDRIQAIAYSTADIFVSPTRAESFGLTVLESMACGTPVVAFGVGGILDLVSHGVTGYLAKPENYTDLSNGIINLIEDQDLRNALGKKSREVAVNKYTLKKQVQQYVILYEHLLKEKDLNALNL